MQKIDHLDQALSRKIPIKRTSRVIMTDTIRVLKEIRLERGLSMRALGQLMEKSDSYVSQIENGRMDVPSGANFEKYLAMLEISLRTFQERVRDYRLKRGPSYRDELMDIAKRANDTQVKQILLLAKTVLAQINW